MVCIFHGIAGEVADDLPDRVHVSQHNGGKGFLRFKPEGKSGFFCGALPHGFAFLQELRRQVRCLRKPEPPGFDL